jgi:flagellar motility protein MotE (MotC chaperone)
MKKLIPIVLILVVPVALGITYGLAKFGVIPVQKLAAKNPTVGKLLTKIGLNSPKLPAPVAAKASAPAPDPLAGEKKVLEAQRKALEEERAAWEADKQAQQKQQTTARRAAAAAAPDPRNVARMASVYEQMPAEAVTPIFTKLPDDQVIALLRKMDEKKVGQILAIQTPERAARLTLALSRPEAPSQTALLTR